MTDPSPVQSKSLLLSRRFAPLFWCQFFSRLQRQFPQERAGLPDPVQARRRRRPEALITLAGAVFIAPFFFLSALGGEIADRYDKAIVAQRLKLAEIARRRHRGRRLLACTRCRCCSSRCSLFGVIAALFGPIKYGILPDHLARVRTAGRQRAGRGRDLPRHPARHHRRRHRGQGRRRPGVVRRPDDGVRAAVLGREPASSRTTGAAAPDLKIDPQHRRARPCALLRALRGDRAAVVGRPGGELVLAGRRGGALAAAAAGEERARRHRGSRRRRSSRSSRSRSPSARASRPGSRTAASCCCRRWSAPIAARRCSRSISAGRRYGTRRRRRAPIGVGECSPRARGIHVAIDLAGLAIAGGLFIVPTFAAVQAWAGADRRARVVAPSTCSTPPSWSAAGIVVAVLQALGVSHADAVPR